MSVKDNPAFLFVHGAWHGAWTWNKVTPLLAASGYASIAIDLPRDGLNAKYPAAFYQRPIDPEAYGTEPSPIAGSSQDDANAATLAAVDQAAALGNGKVVLVGHSLGGVTITHVAELASDKLHAVVYLSAALLTNGVTPGEMLFSEAMSTSLVPTLLLGDPEVIGALRIDPLSADPEYVAGAKKAFYGDVDDETIMATMKLLSCDEPTQILGVPSPVTAENYGSVSRHFIRLTQDMAVTLAAQDAAIADIDAAMPTPTVVHTMETSHSPFLSDPQGLADILARTAA